MNALCTLLRRAIFNDVMWMHIVGAVLACVTSIITAAEPEFPPKQLFTSTVLDLSSLQALWRQKIMPFPVVQPSKFISF
jgi:hypothetical protein